MLTSNNGAKSCEDKKIYCFPLTISESSPKVLANYAKKSSIKIIKIVKKYKEN